VKNQLIVPAGQRLVEWVMNESFGSFGLVPLGGGSSPQPAAIVAQAARSRGAKPEEIYRAWLELAEPRIAAEQTLLNGYALTLADQKTPGERELQAVTGFFDALAAQLFQRTTDVGELSNYMAGDARKWRDLMRAFRVRSAAAKEAPRYHQLTRALAAAEFLASEPIADSDRADFAIDNIRAEVGPTGRTIQIVAQVKGRAAGPRPVPNIAICLRDENGDVCGEAVLAPPVPELYGQRSEGFTAMVDASGEITDVEVSFTRRAAA
jgi:hypothetical protein